MANVLSKLLDVKYFIFDVDGVFTDGGMLVTEDGDMLRTVNAKDGYAVRHAIDKGYHIVIITGGTSLGIQSRFEKLGVPHVHIGVSDKLTLLNKLHETGVIDKTKSLYMGDDIPDLYVMQEVHFPCCPKDAVSEIKEISNLVASRNGGNACVREVIEAVLKVQNNWL